MFYLLILSLTLQHASSLRVAIHSQPQACLEAFAQDPAAKLLCAGEESCNEEFCSQMTKKRSCDSEGADQNLVSRPKLAVCIGGAVRSFAHKIVYATIKTHLIDALAQTTNVSIFMHLKRTDATAHNYKTADKLFPEATDEEMKLALDHLSPDSYEYIEADAVENDKCPWPLAHGPEAFGKGGAGLNFANGLINQLDLDNRCMQTIKASEAESGSRFSYIVRTRPDMMWFLPVRPFCMWPAEGVRFADWAFFLPREQGGDFLEKPHEWYLNQCDKAAGEYIGYTGVEGTRYKILAKLGLEVKKDSRFFPMMVVGQPADKASIENGTAKVSLNDYGGCLCKNYNGLDFCTSMATSMNDLSSFSNTSPDFEEEARCRSDTDHGKTESNFFRTWSSVVEAYKE